MRTWTRSDSPRQLHDCVHRSVFRKSFLTRVISGILMKRFWSIPPPYLLPVVSVMNSIARLALATAATGPEPSIASLGWLAGLTERRWRVQHFRARACPTVTEVVGQVTGLPGRHLDSWLMPEEVCRRLFTEGARSADFALVEGTLDTRAWVQECSSERSSRRSSAGCLDARPACGGGLAVSVMGWVSPAACPMRPSRSSSTVSRTPPISIGCVRWCPP